MRHLYALDKDWLFFKDTANIPTDTPTEGEHVDLPHTWNVTDGQDGGNDYFRGTCCYVRSLKKSELPSGAVYYLAVTGANASADVYINGTHLTHHDGGYSTFRVDITAALQEENCLAILVDNGANDRVYPQMADFTFYGGLYRHVSIIAVPDTHFALEPWGTPGIHVTTDVQGKNATVHIRTETDNLRPEDKVYCTVTDTDGQTVAEGEAVHDVCALTVKKVHLWQGVKDPYLYTATATILRDGETVDTVSTRFGCRTFEIDPARGFILNGEEYPLRGVSRHQDRLGIGNALLPIHHEEDMSLIREMGANTVRLAHYQHDAYFYDLCDRYGMVVWAEIPYISSHMPTANDNTVTQMKELIIQNFNHPSIVVWGLSNEITMQGADDPDLIRQHEILNELAHKLDPTRKTVIACLSVCPIDAAYVHVPDVVSYNHYFGWYGGTYDQYGPWLDDFHAKYPDTPLGVSEYGCEALNWHNAHPEAGDYSEEYQAMYHEALIRQLFNRRYLWATHVWNMFDFGADARAEGGENGQNHKGLITFDRKYKKDAFYAYKAWLSDEPFVHLCGKRYIDRTEAVTRVTVYSNQPMVELLANGESLGRRRAKDHFFYFDVSNHGETTLRAVAGKCTDESVIRRVDTPNEAYILREQGAVLNWFDITEVEGHFSLNDKIGEIAKTSEGQAFVGGLLEMLAEKSKTAEGDGAGMPAMDEMNEAMVSMLDSFSVLRLTSMLAMRNIAFTKDELLDMNRALNAIPKCRE